ncbi:MAG: peptidylprolyl isomerase [Oscillospiraceae bacterium]|nr:peptidylprolyl isomerase [Oscillospiraceae bacterium]
MKKCKFCQAELAENGTFCPNCGRNNVEPETTEETAAPVETASAAQPAAGPEIVENKKATPGKIALMVAAIVVVAAVIVALLAGGLSGEKKLLSSTEDPTLGTAATTEPVAATVPADGNPDDATCKGTYTAADADVLAARDTVVATVGDYTLTNGQLQVFYWMEVQSFLNQYGAYAAYFGLDYTQPLDTQLCSIVEGQTMTWQQFFLESCLGSWQNYQAMSAEADATGFQLDAESLAYLDGLETTLQESAAYNGFETVEELLAYNIGGGATLEDYKAFMELYYKGYLYFNSQYETFVPTEAEVEAYFTENEAAYAEAGVNRDDKYVDVRHILVMPEGGTTDENGSTTYSDAEWETCRQKAQEILDQWLAGDRSQNSFAELANEKTQDGNDANYDGVPDGGLYTQVVVGQMVEPFENWCFDESRVPGDYGLVQTQYGYHVMYFVQSYPVWEVTVEEEMILNNSQKFTEEVTAKYPITADYSAMLLAESGLTAE